MVNKLRTALRGLEQTVYALSIEQAVECAKDGQMMQIQQNLSAMTAALRSKFPKIDGMSQLMMKESEPMDIETARAVAASNNRTKGRTLRRPKKPKQHRIHRAAANARYHAKKLDDADPTMNAVEQEASRKRTRAMMEKYEKEGEDVRKEPKKKRRRTRR